MNNAYQVERKLRERIRGLTADGAHEIIQALDWLDLVVVDRQEYDYLQQRAAELDSLEEQSANRAGESD